MIYIKYKYYILRGVCVLATLGVNFITYGICRHLGISSAVSVGISWLTAVLFAYCCNIEIFYPKSSPTPFVLLKKFGLFAMGRAFAGVADILIMLIFAEKMNFNHYIVKSISWGVVLFINYIISKMIFRRRRREYGNISEYFDNK